MTGEASAPATLRVLLVAPVPTHPSATGASSRIRHMAEALRTLGHEVHFLHLQQPLWTSDTALHGYWGDRLHLFRALSPLGCYRRGKRKLLRLITKSLHLNLPVDSYYDPGAARYLRGVIARRGFDAVIVSYVFYSRLLESVPHGVRKLLDTHDVLADRYRLYREHGQTGEFFSTSRAEEGRALDRADVVLAIQETDARHFSDLSRTPVAVIGHLAPPLPPAIAPLPEASPPVLLFVGGPMGINVHGVSWFLDEVMPRVRREMPDAELWLVGGIGERIPHAGREVRRFGFVDRVEDVYRRAAVVVNPQRFGTGLSIKSVDALRHGRPLVTTTSGARGLEGGVGTAFLQAGSPGEFAGHLVRLLRDPAEAAALGRRASEFSSTYYERNLRRLAELVSGSGPR